MSKIRHLRASDIPSCLELSRQAGWNQLQSDWERMLSLAPDTSFGIEADGAIVSTATALKHGPDLAWIGMVLTHERHRGKGLATSLVQHAISSVSSEVRWIKLDASDQGKQIYVSLGFTDECPVSRWRRPAGPSAKSTSYLIHDYAIDPSFDRAYFGAHRLAALNALRRDGECSFVVSYGYAMSRPGELAHYFGPCGVRSTEAARALLEHTLEKHADRDIFWDLFTHNKEAVRLARQYGFQPERSLTRMAKPSKPGELPILRNESSIFAIAGFEYG
jgi:GNAT superfamily N-acetyltransferase